MHLGVKINGDRVTRARALFTTRVDPEGTRSGDRAAMEIVLSS